VEKLKVGVIGSGFIAEHHCYGYSLLPNVEITAISSLLSDEAKELMKKYNVPGKPYKDYKKMLELDLDVVSLCLPNYLHKDVAIDIVNSDKHVLVEKPLARTVDEGKKMLIAARKAKRKIFYCENNMYAPSFSKVKEIINEGGLGDIYMGRGKEHHSGPHSEWFYKSDKAGGGALLDLGIHDIACLVWYLDTDIEKVFCQTTTTIPDRGEFGKCEVEDNAVGVLYFANGAQIVIEESWCAPGGYQMLFELYGTEGEITVNPTRMTPIRTYSEKGYGYAVEKAGSTKGWTFPVPEEGWTFGYPQEIKYFVECIESGNDSLTDGRYGLMILNIVEAMYKSAESGKIEKV
jgi:myo-inositol 2-dehydrogenase/D-chiro-inositol 1-dehydrogenase